MTEQEAEAKIIELHDRMEAKRREMQDIMQDIQGGGNIEALMPKVEALRDDMRDLWKEMEPLGKLIGIGD